MSKLFFCFFSFFVFTSLRSLAQDYFISGKVTDSTGALLPDVVVTLLKSADSSAAGFEITDTLGAFSFQKMGTGSYFIAIQHPGFAPFTFPLDVQDDIQGQALVLSKDIHQLAEVTVTDRKPYIETAFGKTILNIDPATVSAGSSVLELLRKAPGVQVQGSGITLQGTGVLLLVDDKQTYLSGEELAHYLESLSADMVARIELIGQPSSRYDAEGSGGIINIKTRKLRKKGLNGNISLAAGQAEYPNSHNSANISYQQGDLTIYANAAQMIATQTLRTRIQQQVSEAVTGKTVNQSVMQSLQKETFADYSLRIGVDYTFNKKITGGAGVKGIYHPNDEHDETQTNQTDHSGRITYNKTSSDLGFLRNHYICNGFFKYTPAENHSITVNGDYIYRKQKGYLDLSSINYDEQGQPAGDNLDLLNDSKSLIHASIISCDYGASLAKDWALEAGLKASFSSTENGVHFQILENNQWIKDIFRTNTFIYNEQISAAYVSANKPLGSKWKAQGGLRVEQTNATGRQVVTGEEFTRASVAVFPTAFVSYAPNEKHSLELNCGRRISRPAYTQLNPFLFFRSQFNYFQGNPNLLPSYDWFATVRHSFQNKIFTTARCSKTSGVITPAVRFDSGSNAVIASLGNLASRSAASLSVNASHKFYNWWRCSPNIGVNYNAYNDIDRNKAISSAVGFYFSIENEFTISKGFTVDTSYHFAQGDLQNLLDHYGPRHWTGLNISKKIWKDSATIRLSVDDLFNINRVSSRFDYDGIQRASSNKWSTQRVALGFVYNFGNAETAAQRQKAPEEAGRM